MKTRNPNRIANIISVVALIIIFGLTFFNVYWFAEAVWRRI